MIIVIVLLLGLRYSYQQYFQKNNAKLYIYKVKTCNTLYGVVLKIKNGTGYLKRYYEYKQGVRNDRD